MKLNIKKGDKVKVIAGEFKGKEGRVLSVSPKENRAKVEGLNLVKRHTKPNAQNPNGGIIEKEAPIHISNLMLIDGKGNPTRIKRDRVDGKLTRVSKKSGEVIK
ncbi:MAG: 50S ribosomal protein L24 [Bacteroidota bacterium]|nr:50S ribosomal protein L24 [Bacteroidota bacterium]MDX5431419.1 50S ribosomal protein L24 [Bacteroidota bacterium]MDX5470147.1 50S ribosomal protein L24 [Bacteroidota bacterium]